MNNNKIGIGCKLSNVEAHYDENGVLMIDNFKIECISLVSDPVDDYCKLNLVKESVD